MQPTARVSKEATVVWFLALLATLPWLAALEHLGALPAEAAHQDLADGAAWPGLLAARIIGGIAVGFTVVGAWVIARRAPHLVAGVPVLLLVGACSRAVPALDTSPFEAEILGFEAADRASPPPIGGVVFIGSSSIKNWADVAADFPGLPVLNRGFGGSTLANVVYYEDRILLPYRPRLVVLYAGDNDLAMGRTPERVVGDYRAFIARLRSVLPAARVAFVSIKPSPSRRAYIDRVRETNRRIRMEIARDSLQAYVDIFTPMLDATGEPRPELFLADSLHMTRAGYLLWRTRLAPVVR